jgi:hypothetical protein
VTLNPALNHAGHDADAEKVGLVEGSFSVNGNTDGFSKFNVPLKTAGFMNHDCGNGERPCGGYASLMSKISPRLDQ